MKNNFENDIIYLIDKLIEIILDMKFEMFQLKNQYQKIEKEISNIKKVDD